MPSHRIESYSLILLTILMQCCFRQNSVAAQAAPSENNASTQSAGVLGPPTQTANLAQRTVIRPRDNGRALVNPGMGWVLYNYDDSITKYTADLKPSDAAAKFPGASIVYMRLPWSYLEPREGQFNWAILDTPMQRWLQAGMKVGFRFTDLESGVAASVDSDGFATPKWVMEEGAKGYFHKVSRSPAGIYKSEVWEPDYNDPIFLAKLSDFLAAAATRYDGNPNVAFIDVALGLWGEGHPWDMPYNATTIRRYIDLYREHFKQTLLVANDDFANQGRGLETLGYARDQGLTLRDDSILVLPGEQAYYHAFLSYDFWPRVPVILESEHYGGSKSRGAWGDGHLYLQAIEDYHASYASIHWYPDQFLAENRDLISRINMRLGYRLQLEEISWPSTVAPDGTMEVGYRWRNAGVAPCLPGGHPAVTLEDESGAIFGVFVDEDFDIRDLPVALQKESKTVARIDKPDVYPNGTQRDKPLISFRLPPQNVLPQGTYFVYISVGDTTGRPTISLPLEGNDGNNRYRIGTISIK